MVAEGNDYSISRNRLRTILQNAIENFQKTFRWATHTIYDLENQLLVHNFLEVFGNEVNFWHASFRDYFAALSVIKLPHEQIIENIKQKNWSAVTAFVDGLLEESKIPRQTLADIALNSTTLEDAYWPIETLGLIGSDTTTYILYAISKPSFESIFDLVNEILDKRDFEGKEIFQDVFGLFAFGMSANFANEEYFYSEDSFEWFPNTELIYVPHSDPIYANIMLALSQGDIAIAESYAKNLYRFYRRLAEEIIDPWLLSRVTGYNDFCYKLAAGELNNSEIQDFCRNTVLISSVPYLEKILWSIQDKKIRSLAFIAIQCVIRT